MAARIWSRCWSSSCWSGADDDAEVAVVLHEAFHEGGGGEIGLGGDGCGLEGGQAAPEVEGVGKFFEPDFLGEEELGVERGVAD